MLARLPALPPGPYHYQSAESEYLSSEDDHKGPWSERSSKERMCILVLVLLCLSVVSSLAVVYSARWILDAFLPPPATTDLADEPILRLEVAPLAGYGSDIHVKLEHLPTVPNAPPQETPPFEFLPGKPSGPAAPLDVARGHIGHGRHRQDDGREPRPVRLDLAFEGLSSLRRVGRKNVRKIPLPRDSNQPKKTAAPSPHRSQEPTAMLQRKMQ